MPINAKNYAKAQELLGGLESRVGAMEPNTFMHQRESTKLQRLRRDMDEFETSQRQTDEAGKLVTAPTHTRVPATVGEPTDGGSYNMHFEPSVHEVREMLRRDPNLAREANVNPEWLASVAEPERIEDVADPMSGAIGGQTVAPAVTWLDKMDSTSSAYKDIAEHIWKKRRTEAETKGEAIQRYKDVPPDADHWKQYMVGGAEYNIEKRLTPAALGVANSYTAGTAAPAYDAARQPASLRPGHGAAPSGGFMPPWARALSTIGVDEEAIPSSQDIINRSPGSYLAGNILGYAGQLNPTNLAAEGAIKALGYAGRSMPGKMATSAAVGGAVNAAEGAVGDFANAMSQGQDFGDAAMTAASGMPLNAAAGAVGGGAFDAGGQVLGMMRDGYRGQTRLQGLKTLEDAGGDTSVWSGVTAPPEVQAAYDASKQPGAVGTAGARLAEPVAQEIEGSLAKQAADEQARIQDQVNEYFNHPTYGSIEVPSAPLLNTLFQLAAPGRLRGPVTGQAMHIDPRILKTIGTEARNFSEVAYVPQAEAAKYAHENGGVPLDHELASQVYGESDEFLPGTVPIAVPRPLTARLLTELEERIYRELGISNNSAGRDDPVYRQLDRATKEMRDQFPYYTDEAGALVDPPATPSQAPFAPADDMPAAGPSRPSQLPRPRSIDPSPRQPAPEAIPGAGPGAPPLPVKDANPFDPSPLEGVSRARLDPQAPVSVTGGPVNRPEVLPPEAVPGIGPQRRQRGTTAVAGAEPAPARPTVDVQGEYSKPPEIERAPDTQPMALDRARMTREPELIPDEAVNSIRPEPLKLDEPFQGTDDLDQSIPAPTAKEWTESTDESAKWTEDILAPGSDARSAEAKRMGDLMEQMRGEGDTKAFEEAKFMVDNVDKRLGPLTEPQREKMLMDVLKERLGREVTREDLIKAGIITAGAAGVLTAEDDEMGASMASAGGLSVVLGGRPKSPEAKALLDELGSYMSPKMLKKPKLVKAIVKDIGNWGLSPEETQGLIDDVMDYHHRVQSEPDSVRAKPAPKAYVSEIDHTPDSGRREIGSSLKLGPRFKGDAEEADALLQKTRKELPPPPEATTPYAPNPSAPRGYDISKPSKGIQDLEVTSYRKYRELDREEKEAVDQWMGNSRILREEQRNGIPLFRSGPKAPQFESAMDKLTVVNPTKHGTLYRRFYAEDREMAELLSNNYYEAGAAMSSGYFPNGTFGPHELRFKKVDQAGALIGANGSEAEMVIPKGGRFKVTNRYFDKKANGYVIELEEIPLTQENLLKEVGYLAVPFAAGAAADAATDGDGEFTAAGAAVGGIRRPKQLEATLDDGKTVKGFSALRRGQHTEQEAIEKAKKRVGANSEETLPRRVQNFNQGKADVRYDDALLEEAKKVGKERELRSAAAANVYPELNDMSTPFGGNQGFAKSTVDNLMLRLDKPLEYLSGSARNPFARAPNSLGETIQREYMADPARRLLNATGGRPGARFGEHVRELLFDEQEKEDRKRRKEKNP